MSQPVSSYDADPATPPVFKARTALLRRLADVVCLTLFEDAAERAALHEGLAEGGGRTPQSEDDERRLALYRAYLWLIMLVEAAPRGFGGSIRLPGSKAARRLMRDLARAEGTNA